MEINVAQLLKEPRGSVRSHNINEATFKLDNTKEISLSGNVIFIRTDKGILMKGQITILDKGSCARCLKTVDYQYDINIEEEILPLIDIVTGQTLKINNDVFAIDNHHNINLTGIFQQYARMETPMKILCSVDCAGFCPVCGNNLNDNKCNCRTTNYDPRWSKLMTLKKEE